MEEWKDGKTVAGYERIVSSQPGKTIGLRKDRFSRSRKTIGLQVRMPISQSASHPLR